jgi:cation:H+ antiporter
MTELLATLPIGLIAAIFLLSGAIVVAAGIRLTGHADRLADLTGLGEAVTGAIFLGASTSLAGITSSVVTALSGRPELSLANAFGGIAAQTAFLALADLTYRRANLEHAAASIDNLLQGALLVALLSLIVAGSVSPDITVAGVHPVTVVLVAGYAAGLRLVRNARGAATWRPVHTADTRPDVPEEPARSGRARWSLGIRFALLAAAVMGAGWVLAQTAEVIADRTVLSDSMVGALLLAVVTSLPELVTTLAAVRRGALTLAVGGIIGGNAFDSLFAAAADIAYREGSIYHAAAAAGDDVLRLLSVSIVMAAVLLLGLLRRERRGVAGIGFESGLILALYLFAVGSLAGG